MVLDKDDIKPDSPDEVNVIEQPNKDVTDDATDVVGDGAEEGPKADPED